MQVTLRICSMKWFLYTNSLDLNLQTTPSILEAAKTYAVQELVDKCLNLLKNSMTANSVCKLMETGHLNGNEALRRRCLTFIVRDPEKVFSSGTLTDICSDCLSLILQDDNFSMEEEKVFHYVLKFAESKCRAISLEATGQNERVILGAALEHIRFPCMSKEFFNDVVQPSGILTDSESVRVFKYFISPENGCELFLTTPRNFQRKASRFLDVAKGWGYKRDKQDVITFTCSHDVIVKGVELFGTSEDTAKYEINLMLMQLPFHAVVQRKHAVVETNSKSQTYKLMFDQAGVIAKRKEYELLLTCRGPPSYYGVKGLNLVEEEGVSFTFKPNAKSTNNTTVERGQIASIIYSLVAGNP